MFKDLKPFFFVLYNIATSTEPKEIDLSLPKPWNVGTHKSESEDSLIFTYVVENNVDDINKHVFEKTVLINSKRKINYEIYSTPVSIDNVKLPRVLEDVLQIPNILKNFKNMKICKGFKYNDFKSISLEGVVKNSLSNHWFHKECALLSLNYDRCFNCKKYSNNLYKKIKEYRIKVKFDEFLQ